MSLGGKELKYTAGLTASTLLSKQLPCLSTSDLTIMKEASHRNPTFFFKHKNVILKLLFGIEKNC